MLGFMLQLGRSQVLGFRLQFGRSQVLGFRLQLGRIQVPATDPTILCGFML